MARAHLSRRWWILSALVLAAAAAVLLHPVWMRALGWYLVKAEQPSHADVALVLGGDAFGNRILKAAELVRHGFTARVLVSGPEDVYGYNEAELAVAFAVHHGNPPPWFIPLPVKAHSTREEARAVVPYLRKLGVKRALLVTSDYHTRRAGAIYREAAPDMQFLVVAAPDQFFRPDDWWRAREGQKRFVLEWMKTISGWFGI